MPWAIRERLSGILLEQWEDEEYDECVRSASTYHDVVVVPHLRNTKYKNVFNPAQQQQTAFSPRTLSAAAAPEWTTYYNNTPDPSTPTTITARQAALNDRTYQETIAAAVRQLEINERY